jgi:hypothetical protein
LSKPGRDVVVRHALVARERYQHGQQTIKLDQHSAAHVTDSHA